MIDDRVQLLLNAELDGELDAGDRAELDALLAARPELHRERDALRGLVSMLSQVADLDPPAGMARRVMTGIRLPSPPRQWWRIARWTLNPMALPFAAFAAGLIVAVGTFMSLPDRLMLDDSAVMVGSMVRDQTRAGGKPLDSLALNLKEISGKVTLGSSSADTRILEFELKSAGAVDIAVNLAGTGLEFGGFAQRDAGVGMIASDADALRLRSQGEHQFAVFLRAPGAADAAKFRIELEFSEQHEQLYRGALESP